MTFLESWDQTGSETHLRKFDRRIRKFENLTLCDPVLTRTFSVVGLHGVRLQNGLDFWILLAKVTLNHVPHARRIIFNSGDPSWPLVTWPWPWPVLSMALMLTGFVISPLRLFWPSFEQKLSILPTLGSVIQKRQIWPLIWLWPETLGQS